MLCKVDCAFTLKLLAVNTRDTLGKGNQSLAAGICPTQMEESGVPSSAVLKKYIAIPYSSSSPYFHKSLKENINSNVSIQILKKK